jgi:tetratricopeptide (TPR) repeat protein
LGRYEDALADFNRLIELDPNDAWAIARRAETYQALERYEDALADLDRAIELDPENTFALVKEGEIYQALERYKDAKLLYQRALEIQHRVLGPEHPDTVHTREALEVVQASIGKRVHVVQPGDTFYTLAEKYYGDEKKYEAIAKANPEAHATRLSTGQMLRIP